jgi:hypothetical protein
MKFSTFRDSTFLKTFPPWMILKNPLFAKSCTIPLFLKSGPKRVKNGPKSQKKMKTRAQKYPIFKKLCKNIWDPSIRPKIWSKWTQNRLFRPVFNEFFLNFSHISSNLAVFFYKIDVFDPIFTPFFHFSPNFRCFLIKIVPKLDFFTLFDP